MMPPFLIMGITIVQKSDLTVKRPNAKKALVLAGGAITGGTFKVGGLKALNDFLLNRKITDFDTYIGLSAGAILAAPLAGGIGPEEILKGLDGSSRYFSQFSPLHIYKPNFREFFERPVKYLYRRMAYVPGILYDVFQSLPYIKADLKERFLALVSNPGYSRLEELLDPLAKVIYTSRTMPSLAEAIPGGIFDNSPVERYMRGNMERNHLTNNFKVLKRIRKKDLYIVATVVDTAKREVFGHDEKNDVTISEAVQASTALPGFYKPVRLKGVEYVDGAVRRTANIGVAVDKGCELIVAYNPFRPFNNELVLEFLKEENKYVTKGKHLSDFGFLMVINQAMRTLFHTRLRFTLEHYQKDPNFKGDIILIEPRADDSLFFELNPLAFWQRAAAAKMGFNSVRESIERRYDDISQILAAYGIEMSRERVDQDFDKMVKTGDDQVTMQVLEEERPRRRLRVVRHRS